MKICKNEHRKCNKQRTPLYIVAMRNSKEMLEILISKGAVCINININVKERLIIGVEIENNFFGKDNHIKIY